MSEIVKINIGGVEVEVNLDDDDDDFDDDEYDEERARKEMEECPFCMGDAAARNGEPDTANPFVRTDAQRGSVEWYESDFGLWDIGHGIASAKLRDESQ